MTVDLDELERKARAEMAAQAAAPANVITLELGRAAWAHHDAMRPPVTLALIARIRELEMGFRRAIEFIEGQDQRSNGRPVPDPWRVLLEKGVVLP